MTDQDEDPLSEIVSLCLSFQNLKDARDDVATLLTDGLGTGWFSVTDALLFLLF